MLKLFKRIEHRIYKDINRLRLKNKDFTIISSNCVGTMMYHDLSLRFNSPTINLFFEAKDFIKFVKNLKHYCSIEAKEIESPFNFPVGKLDDITVYFMHYSSFDEAKRKWEKRVKRINYDNLFIIMTERTNCDYNVLLEFDKLDYENKVVLTHLPYEEIKSSYYIPGFEYKTELGTITDFKDGFLMRRWMDKFDYVSFLNKKGE